MRKTLLSSIYLWESQLQQVISNYSFHVENIANVEFVKTRSMKMTDFIASVGGLFGLFAGFSFLSLVEIIYWIIFKYFCNFLNMFSF